MCKDKELLNFTKPFKDRPDVGIGDAIYDCLYEAIMTAKLPAGYKLNEVVLAKAFDVSRTPIQKALTRLECYGLIASDRKKGHVVASFTYSEATEINEFYLALHTTSMLMCKRRGVDTYYQGLLKKRISKMKEQTDLSDYLALLEDFHYQVACCTRNTIYINSVKHAGDRAQLMGMVIPAEHIEFNVTDFIKKTNDMVDQIYYDLVHGTIAELVEYMESEYIPHIREFGNLCLEHKTSFIR